MNYHAPQAFLAGDIPPPKAGKADPKADGVSCDLCHSITATLNYRRLPQSVAALVDIGKVPILHVAADQAIVEVK